MVAINKLPKVTANNLPKMTANTPFVQIDSDGSLLRVKREN